MRGGGYRGDHFLERVQALRRQQGSRCVYVLVCNDKFDFYFQQIELWHVFHDELDLDGNGHLDAEELATALSHAGEETEAL